MRSSERCQERTIPLIEEEDAVHFIGTAQISDQSSPESMHIGVEEAKRASLFPIEVHFGGFLCTRAFQPHLILNRAEYPHASLLCSGQYFSNNIQIVKVRRLHVIQNGVFIEFGMRCCKVPSKEWLPRGSRLAMVMKRTFSLAAGEALTMSKSG